MRKSTISNRPKWEPKKWRPEYDRVVALSVLGKANTWIAERVGFTKEYVSLILNLPQGVELAEKLQAKLMKQIEVDIPKEMNEIAQLATSRLKTLLKDDTYFEKSPFAVVDRGLDVLKGLKYLKGASNPDDGAGIGAAAQITNITNNTTNVTLTPTQRSDVMDGLEKIREIKQLHAASVEAKESK